MNRIAPLLLSTALLLALSTVVRSAEPGGPRRPPGSMGPMLFTLLKVEERSITVKAILGTDKGPPVEQALAVDGERTRVTITEVTDERTENGEVTKSSKSRAGTLADLKVGQTVRIGAADGVATRVDIYTPPPAKGDKKGADKKDGNQK